MLTRYTDYRYMTPSESRIKGKIIPVSDIANKPSTLRKEDLYYIHEMYAYYRHLRSYSVSLNLDENIEAVDFSTPVSYLAGYRSIPSQDFNGDNFRLVESFSGFDGGLQIGRNPKSLLQLMREGQNEKILRSEALPTTYPDYKNTLKANFLRTLYWFMNLKHYEQFTPSSSNPSVHNDFLYTIMGQPILTSHYYSSDSDGNIVDDAKNYNVVLSNWQFMFIDESESNPSYTSSVGSASSIQRYNTSSQSYEYRWMNGLPNGDLEVDIALAEGMNAESCYIGIEYRIERSSDYRCWSRSKFVPLTKSGDTAWSFNLYDVNIVKQLFNDAGIQWNSDSDWHTGGNTPVYSLSIFCGHPQSYPLMVKLSSKYTSLPTGWNWTPTQSS